MLYWYLQVYPPLQKIYIGAHSGDCTAANVAALAASGTDADKIIVNSSMDLNIIDYTTQDLSGITGTGTVKVTTTTGAVIDGDSVTELADVDFLYIDANITIDAAHLLAVMNAGTGCTVQINDLKTLSVINYVSQALGPLTNEGTGIIDITTTTNAVIDPTELADAKNITIAVNLTGGNAVTASDLASIIASTLTKGGVVTVNNGITLDVTGYINNSLGGLVRSGTPTINVTTATASVATISNTNLTKADTITIACANANPAVGTAADAATLASKITVNTACTYNISAYNDENLSALTNNGTINVTSTGTYGLDFASLVDATTINITDGTVSVSAADLISLGTSKVTNSGGVLDITAYSDTQDLSGLTHSSGTTKVTTSGATLDENSDAYLIDATDVYIDSTVAVSATDLTALMAVCTVTVNAGKTLNVSTYDDENFANLVNSAGGTVNVTTKAGAVLESAKLPSVTEIYIGANSGDCTAANVAALAASDTDADKITINDTFTLNVIDYTNQDLSDIAFVGGSSVLKVTTINGATLDDAKTPHAQTQVTIGAGTTTTTATNLATFDESRVITNGGTLTVTAYTTQDLSDLTYTSGTVNVTTTTGAVIDAGSATDLADATHVYIGADITITATNLAALMGACTVTVNNNITLTVSNYTNQLLGDLEKAGSGSKIEVETIDGASLHATKLVDATKIHYKCWYMYKYCRNSRQL